MARRAEGNALRRVGDIGLAVEKGLRQLGDIQDLVRRY